MKLLKIKQTCFCNASKESADGCWFFILDNVCLTSFSSSSTFGLAYTEKAHAEIMYCT